MRSRRFTRLTNAFSKKLENLQLHYPAQDDPDAPGPEREGDGPRLELRGTGRTDRPARTRLAKESAVRRRHIATYETIGDDGRSYTLHGYGEFHPGLPGEKLSNALGSILETTDGQEVICRRENPFEF